LGWNTKKKAQEQTPVSWPIRPSARINFVNWYHPKQGRV
jgi:hypothetical protein